MSKFAYSQHFLGLSIAAMLMLVSNSVWAESIGKVVFSSAGVQIQSASGATKLAAKGLELESGDTIETGAGSMQMRMSDGALLSLQANTKFRFDEYRYQPNNPDKSRSLLSLLKGGLRSVTGLIGKERRKNYQLHTPAATLGIRGTDYSVVSKDNGDTFSVASGAISVCNQGGCVDVDAGQSAFTPKQTVRPIVWSTLKSSELNDNVKPSVAPTSASALSISTDGTKDIQPTPVTVAPVTTPPVTIDPNMSGPITNVATPTANSPSTTTITTPPMTNGPFTGDTGVYSKP